MTAFLEGLFAAFRRAISACTASYFSRLTIVGPTNKGERNQMQKYRRGWTVPMLLPQECGRSGNGSKCSHHRSGQNFTVLLACIRHYFPRRGGNLNCAGAHHGTLTPPRISRSCVQEYHYGLTGSWRDSLPKLSWPEWVSLCTLLGRPLMRNHSAQVVFAHSA